MLTKYLGFYTNALKNQAFKCCYIDAFAGSGEVNIPGSGTAPGSAILALDYPFDRYIFIEKDPRNTASLQKRIGTKNVEILEGDCNQHLVEVCSYPWKLQGWRGIIFLDPFATELHWSSLREIANKEAFDVWYLFPLMAMNRLLRRDRNIPDGHRTIIDNLLGTTDWESEIYRLSPQMSIFEDEFEKAPIEAIKNYVISRLKTVFPAVSQNAKVLTTVKTNTPMFLLCFATSNPSHKAIGLALRAANHILTHT